MSCEICDIQVPIGNIIKGGQRISVGHKSLKKIILGWVRSLKSCITEDVDIVANVTKEIECNLSEGAEIIGFKVYEGTEDITESFTINVTSTGITIDSNNSVSGLRVEIFSA